MLDEGDVRPRRAAALVRLKDRVDQLDRHRQGTDPATMPLPRPVAPRFGDDRGSGVVRGRRSGPDVDRTRQEAIGVEADVPVHVAVLGHVEVRRLGHVTPQQQALICFLALRPGAGRDDIVGALWDGRAISESRFLNLIAETRAVVGSSRLPPAGNGRYSVEGLTVDADLLTEAGRRADQARRSHDPHQERRWLRRGLSLISGPLLRPPGRRYWTWLDDAYDIVARLESTIVAQSARLADLALTSDDQRIHDVEVAEWAYQRCLLAMPHHDEVAHALAELYRRTGRRSAALSLGRSRTRYD
jgi:DNA-binding SARP family transcriptional activator